MLVEIIVNTNQYVYVIGSEKTCHVEKTYFHFIYDDYKTAYALYIALYYILIECSEVKLRLFLKSCEEKLRESLLKLKFRLRKKYSVFLCKSVLHNYVIISLQCIAYIRR